jgi:hypothetical protein
MQQLDLRLQAVLFYQCLRFLQEFRMVVDGKQPPLGVCLQRIADDQARAPCPQLDDGGRFFLEDMRNQNLCEIIGDGPLGDGRKRQARREERV